jgi:hypothetical protein
MALTIPTPWITGPDVSGGLSSGAAAGGRAASIAAGRDESAARLAQDAMQHNEANKMEAARLSQQERLSMMEASTRKEIAQQNQLREQQRLAIEQAYHTAQIGLAKGRLEEQQAIADAKSKEAAMRIQRERDFGEAVASGMSVMDAYRKFPVPASVVNAFTHAEPKPAKEEKPRYFNSKGKILKVNPDGTTEEVYTPKDEGPSILGAASGGATEQPGMFERAKRFLTGTPAAAPSARVKVRSKDGKIGTIPASQLDEALASGYTKAE